MDRHLDQLLMCAIYVMAKVTKDDRSFQNIMRCYRTQPQARSQVYRSVLIKGKRKRRNSGSSDSRSHQNSPTELNRDRTSRDSSPVMRSSSTLPVPQPSSAPPTPTRLTGANSDMEEEERGDLIQFYNNVYIKQIKTFAMKYSQANVMDAPPLSPYPFVRTGSPRRIQLSQNHPVYISPHKNETMLSPREKIFYYFSNSPSKRLREINSMIRTGETPTKKRGILLEDGSESPAKRICPENHSALLRRLQDVANDRGSHWGQSLVFKLSLHKLEVVASFNACYFMDPLSLTQPISWNLLETWGDIRWGVDLIPLVALGHSYSFHLFPTIQHSPLSLLRIQSWIFNPLAKLLWALPGSKVCSSLSMRGVWWHLRQRNSVCSSFQPVAGQL